MSLQDTLNLPPAELRAHIAKYWKAYPKSHYGTMGVLLRRVKQESLAQAWGYKKYSHYIVKELDIIPPSIANIWTGIVHKLEFFYGYSAEEIEGLEQKVPQQLMAVSLRYAQSREELEGIWKRADYKSIAWKGLDRQRFIEREARKAAWKNLFFNDQEALLMEGLASFLRARYGIVMAEGLRGNIVVALALVYKALIECWPREIEERLKRDLEKFNLPVEIADIKNAMWIGQRDGRGKSLESLAEELLRRKS